MGSTDYFERKLSEVERILNEGNLVEASRLLQKLSTRRGSRRFSVRIARIWRYLHRPLNGMRLLQPDVYPPAAGRRRLVTEGREDSRLEYAALLVKAGAAREGLRILEGIPFRKLPAKARQIYLATVQLWLQERAIKHLIRFLSLSSIQPDEREAARLELADCYLYGLNDAETSWKHLEEGAEAVRGKTFENWLPLAQTQIRLQCAYIRGDSKEIASCVARLRGEFRVEEINSWVALEARMYETLERARRAARLGRGLRVFSLQLAKISREFHEVGRWEFSRQCDAYWAIAGRDPALFRHVYFLSPLESFREKLLHWARGAMSARDLELPERVDLPWRGRGGARGLRWVIDLESGWVLSVKDGRPAPGQWRPKSDDQLPSRLLVALASDAYRPPVMIELHEEAYPDIAFDPLHGAARVHRGLARLREWLASVPVLRGAKVVESGGRYTLCLPERVGVRAYRRGAARRAPARVQDPIERLRSAMRGKPFTPEGARAALRTSERTTRRLLAAAVKAGLLARVVAGPATEYRFVKGA